MNFQKTIFASLYFILLGFGAFAQTDAVTLKTIAERKLALSDSKPFESVYLHFDKPYYAVGDTVWFKAYLTTQQHIPSPLSKIVYVELINSKDSLIETLKLPLTNSVANGQLLLAYPDFKEGSYHIRAYTKWMLNFDQSYFFSKNLYVGNALNKDLKTNITFKGIRTDKGAKLNSKVTYLDELGKPLANQKVSWEVVADGEKAIKGKGITDASGKISIDFSASNKVDINAASLNTLVETGDKKILKANFPLKTAILENDIQFFPEGGILLDGIEQKVAFKAIQSNGLGINLKGKIVDEQGQEIATLQAQHLGMGNFSFSPQSNKNYSAKVNFADGSEKTFALPKVAAKGIVLSAKSMADSLLVNIIVNDAYLQENKNQPFYLVLQNGGVFYYAAQSVLQLKNYNIKLAKEKFPTGILQIALLNQNGVPLSERLVFNQRKDDVAINIKTDLTAYTARQKIKLNISTKDGIEPTEGSYSVSVVNDAIVPVNEDEEMSIKSYLLLTADLQGFIEKPNYYFHKVDAQKQEHLDNLLLTQGYRRFSYQELAKNERVPPVMLPEQSIVVSGTIRRSSGLPLVNGRLLFQIPDKRFNTTGTTDSEGKFAFKDLVFRDSSDVIINARNNINSKDLKISIDGEAFPSLYSNVNAPSEILNLDSALAAYLKYSRIEHSSAFVLQEVVVKGAAIKKPSHTDFSQLSGLGMMADREISSAQLSACNNLTDCLSGYGLTYIDQQLILTKNYSQGLSVQVAIYANGMQVDANYLSSVVVKDISSIEVFNNDGLSGINKSSNTSGVLVINMKEVKKTTITKDQLKELFPPTNVLTFKPKGYDFSREFYVPKYSGPRTSMQNQDYRSTVYWNPNLTTDKTGNTTLEYFNGDNKGLYRITIEGVDGSGNIGRAVYRYLVK